MKKYLFALTFLVSFSCKKQDPTYPYSQQYFPDEGLAGDEDSILAAAPSRMFSPSEIQTQDYGKKLLQIVFKAWNWL